MTATTDEAVQAAYCQLAHGDPRESAEEKHARLGLSDLIGRTWKANPCGELSRDERRLMSKYQATLDAATATNIAAYRNCGTCHPSRLTTETE